MWPEPGRWPSYDEKVESLRRVAPVLRTFERTALRSPSASALCLLPLRTTVTSRRSFRVWPAGVQPFTRFPTAILARPIAALERFIDDAQTGGGPPAHRAHRKTPTQQRESPSLKIVSAYLRPFERIPFSTGSFPAFHDAKECVLVGPWNTHSRAPAA